LHSSPNVILVVGDHHRANILGHSGCRLAHTPNLDRLCQAGAAFSRAVTVFPEADVALETLLAGVHAHRLPAGSANGLDQSALGQALAARGYRIAQFGSAHALRLADVLGAALAFLDQPGGDPFLVVIRLPSISTLLEIPDWCFTPHRGNGTPLAAHFAAVTAYDDAAGQIVQASGRRHADHDDTLFVYTSLSGEHFKYRDGVSHANTCHDESIRVPLILNWPARIAPGQNLDALVGLHDVAPTIAEIADAPLPPTQGRSLWPLLNGGRAPDWRRRIYVENQHLRHIRALEDPLSATFRLYPAWRQRAIWDGRHKLVLSADQGIASFFDHAIDPEEEFDLYEVPRPSPHRLYEHFRDRRQHIVRLAKDLGTEAAALEDDLGISLAAAAISDPSFGRLGAGERLG
jgi:arylsulfatase A-like enzyme